MTTSASGRRAGKTFGWVGGAGLVLVLASTAACGGSSGGGSGTVAGGSSASAAASPVSSAPTESSAASESSSASEAGTSAAPPAASGSLGKDICGVIKKVQADVIKGSPSAAYQAQLVLGVVGLLSNPSKVEDFKTNGDAEAKKTCPQEYAAFLGQADITTLASL